MAVKKDDTGKRWVELEFVAPGTPEQLWQAMATGGGNSAWFTRTTIEERVGGRVEFDMGPHGKQAAEVTAWEPPHRFGYVERDWSEGAPPVATEIMITARSGGRCVVRMVHSLFAASEDWDDQMEGFEKGWPAFFEILRLYLTHFAGRRAASFMAVAPVEGDHPAAWKRLLRNLDLVGADAGESRTTAPDPEPLSGEIERIDQGQFQRYVLMRLNAPAPGLALVGTYGATPHVNATVTIFFYGDGAEGRAAISQQKWQSWLAELFAQRHDATTTPR